MKLSVVIPAYNEEKYLPNTLEHVRVALARISNVETIVVDNQSTDTTPEIAETFGARVMSESEHNIGKVRNTGAAAANGDVIVFIDADTLVFPGTFEAIATAMSDLKCLGGAFEAQYEGELRRLWVRWFMKLWPLLGKLTKIRGGALQYWRADVFRELGGYDETIWVGEDIDFHWRMDKLAKQRGGHTTFIGEPKVQTSSRRWDRMGLFRMLFFTHPVTIFLAWRVRWFWKDWYENAIR